jgi:hypothetical protein
LISVKLQGYMRPSRAGLHGFSGVISAGVDEGGRGEASNSRGGGRITAQTSNLEGRALMAVNWVFARAVAVATTLVGLLGLAGAANAEPVTGQPVPWQMGAPTRSVADHGPDDQFS